MRDCMHTYFYLCNMQARLIFAASGGRWSQLSAVIHLSWGLISGVNCITQAAATVAPGPARPRPIVLPTLSHVLLWVVPGAGEGARIPANGYGARAMYGDRLCFQVSTRDPEGSKFKLQDPSL